MQRISRYEVPNHSIWYRNLHRTEIYAIKEKPKFPSIIFALHNRKGNIRSIAIFLFQFSHKPASKEKFFCFASRIVFIFYFKKNSKNSFVSQLFPCSSHDLL